MIGVGQAGGFVNFLIGGVQAAVADVFAHGGGEQELRAHSVKSRNMLVLNEDNILDNDPDSQISQFLDLVSRADPIKFDKYSIGKTMIDDLERWKRSRSNIR